MAPQISVCIPMTDPRGDPASHIATWTGEQTLPRDRYQVVVISDGENPAAEREVQALLGPGDVFDRVPGAATVELWNVAAERAGAPWLLFTENHTEGDPGCVAAVSQAIDREELDALTLEIGHIASNPHGEIAARWFDYIDEGWRQPGQWTRLSLAGAAVRRDAYARAGPFEPRYGLFCAPMVAARMNDLGCRMKRAEGARVLHIHNDTIQEHHEHTENYGRGECNARSVEDPFFCDRYFGPARIFRNRLRFRPELARRTLAVLFSSAARAVLRRRQELPWLGKEIAKWLPAAAWGVPPYVVGHRVSLRWSEWATMNLPLSPEARWRSYLRAHARAVRLTHLRWVEEHPESPRVPPLLDRNRPVEELSDHELVGVDGLERHGERWFRWTDASALLRVVRPEREATVRIDTAGLRGSPLQYVRGVYVDGRRVQPSRVRDEEGALAFPLSGGSAGTVAEITVLCRPLVPRKHGSEDPRRLGMPVFGLAVETEASGKPGSRASLAHA